MFTIQAKGKKGERMAKQYLEEINYDILEINYRCKQGEIDIIAKDNKKKELVFIEVKTRTSYSFGLPREAVGIEKQKHILKVAKYYLYTNNIKDTSIRFDVIEVFIRNDKFIINHIEQAF